MPGWPGWARRHNTQQRTAESPRPDSTRVGQDRRALRDAHARARQASESKYTYIKRKRRPAELAKGTASTAAGSAASRTAVTCPPLLASPCAHAALPAHRTRATTTYPALPMLDTRGAYCFECHAHTPPTCAGQVRHASRKDPRSFCRRHVSPRTVARALKNHTKPQPSIPNQFRVVQILSTLVDISIWCTPVISQSNAP